MLGRVRVIVSFIFRGESVCQDIYRIEDEPTMKEDEDVRVIGC